MAHILILHPHFTIAGGAGNFVLEVGERLHDLGYQITVCCIRCEEKIVGRYREKINFIELKGALSSSILHWISLPIFLYRVIKLCKKLDPEIVFPQVFPANWWGFILKFFCPSKIQIWMCQEPSAFIHSKTWINAIASKPMRFILKALNPILRVIDIFLAQKVDFVFANSNYGVSYAREVYGYKPEMIQTLYLGSNQAFFLDNKAPSFAERQDQIITIGRLTKFKNINLIIDAISELNLNQNFNINLKIVGLGEELAALKQYAESKKISNFIEFCGALSLEELVNKLSKSKAFVLASVNEPFGLTVVESLACGTPAIVVENGGPSEIVKNNICGYHVPPYNAFQIAEKIKLLVLQPQIFEEFSKQAQLRALEFTWTETTTKIDKVFRRFLKMNPEDQIK